MSEPFAALKRAKEEEGYFPAGFWSADQPKCPHCGEVNIPDNFTFCPTCRGSLDAAPVDGGTRGLVALGVALSTDFEVHLLTETGSAVVPAVTFTEGETVIEIACCDAGSEYRVLVLTSDGGSPPTLKLILYRLDSNLAILGGGFIAIEVGHYQCSTIGVAYKNGKTWVTWVGKLTSGDDLICVHARMVDAAGSLAAWRKQIWRCSVAARCLVTPEQIDALIDACAHDSVGGLLAHKLADTLKTATAGPGGVRVASTVDRSDKWLAQTPQMFRLQALHDALAAEAGSGFAGITDEASAMERLGLQPRLVEGSAQNFKVTYPADFVLAEAILRSRT